MSFRGFSVQKKQWLYGLRLQRRINGEIYDYIVPDNDKDLKVFLYNKNEFKVDSLSVGRYCPALQAYEGDICVINGAYGFLYWDENPIHYGFFIKQTHADKTVNFFDIHDRGIQITKENLYQKQNMIKQFEKLSTKKTLLRGTEYGRIRLEQKTADETNRKLVRHPFFIRMLDKLLSLDTDWFLSENERTENNTDVIDLLPYFQTYIKELAENQGIIYTGKECNGLEIYSFDFKAGENYYNISTILGIDTITSVFKHKKRLKGPVVVLPMK